MSVDESDTQVLELWAAFDLTGKKVSLEKQLIELRETKTAAVERRKFLNDTTKKFRSLDKNEQINSVTELLKEYQNEIDLLTKRSKNGEGAFVGLYKLIYEVPDPVPALQNLIDKIKSGSSSGLEISRLQGELAQYEEEFKLLKNQDIKIRHLEEQIKRYEDNASDKVAEAVTARVTELESAAEDRIREYQELVRQAERRMVDAQESQRAAQSSLERSQSQLLQLSTHADRRQSDLLSENQMIAEVNARLSSRVAELENSITVLMAERSGGSRDDTMSENVSMRSKEERSLRDTVAELQIQVHMKEDALRAERVRSDAIAAELQEESSRLKNDLAASREDAASRPSADELVIVKQQLRALQKLVYRIEDDDNAVDPSASQDGDLNKSKGSTESGVETVMMHRIHSLETQLLEVKRTLRDAQNKEAESTELVSNLKESLNRSAELISKLEKDLEVRTSAENSKVGDAKAKTPDPGMTELSLIIEGAPSPGDTTGVMVEGDGARNMVTILQGQRDRYKEKLSQVEAEMMLLQKQVTSLTLDKEKLEKDNLELFEKIKYLQTYSQRRDAGKDVHDEGWDEEYFAGGGTTEVIKSFKHVAESVEIKYRNIYEKQMNPFAQFSQLEKQRKVSELNVADRLLLNTVTSCVSSQTGRRFLVAYLAVMHLLVFGTLYAAAHRTHHDCPPCLMP